MTLEIRHAKKIDAQDWDSIIDRSSYGTIFHHWDWLDITQKYTGTTLIPLMVTKGENPVGVFPLFLKKRGIYRTVFSPPPHSGLFYLGPVLIDDGDQKQDHREMRFQDFHRAIEKVIREEIRPNYISIALPPGLTDPRSYTWSGYSVEPRYDYSTDLTLGEEILYSALSKKQRQDINRSQKRGVSVELGGKEEYVEILDLMESRYREQEKPTTIPRGYLLDLYERYKENMVIFAARYREETITGLIDLQYRNSISSWIGNPRPRMSENVGSPNLFVGWEAIKQGCRSGCTSYVTMSAAGNERLHGYYSSQFNPSLKIRFHAKKMTFAGQILEKGYIRIIKPLHSIIGSAK